METTGSHLMSLAISKSFSIITLIHLAQIFLQWMLAWLDLNILKGDGHKSLIMQASITVIQAYGTTRQFVPPAWCGTVFHFVGSTLHVLYVA